MPGRPVVKICKQFKFDSAHRLPSVPDGHPCGRIHGHSYMLEVEVSGQIDNETGWLMDYDELKRVVNPWVDGMDHQFLNDIEGLKHTTAEEIAVWFWNRLQPQLPGLTRITIYENPTSRCDYYGEVK